MDLYFALATVLCFIACVVWGNVFNRTEKHKLFQKSISVPIDYILFCLSEEYQMDIALLNPLIKNEFNVSFIKYIVSSIERKKKSKTEIAHLLASSYNIEIETANKVFDYIMKQVNEEYPFSPKRMGEFKWRKANIHDAIESIEDISYEFKANNTFIYKIKNEKYIFNNLSEFKKSIERVPMIMESGLRTRMSLEVRGQPRTGKTLCSKYVLPYFCARMINEMRKQNGLVELCKIPVFYLMLNRHQSPLIQLYSLLKNKLGEITSHDGNEPISESDYVFGIQSYIEKYFEFYPNSHMFIILDEFHLIQSKHLDSLKIICKSTDFPKCTFILTGSTMAIFEKTLYITYRNGLSYFENNTVYEIPFYNTKKEIKESLEVLKKWGFVGRVNLTYIVFLQLRAACTDLNVAYANQIFERQHSHKDIFENSLSFLLSEIFKSYETSTLRKMFTSLRN